MQGVPLFSQAEDRTQPIEKRHTYDSPGSRSVAGNHQLRLEWTNRFAVRPSHSHGEVQTRSGFPAGHVSRAMLSRYSHVRMEAKRRALDEIAARQRTASESETKGRGRGAGSSAYDVCVGGCLFCPRNSRCPNWDTKSYDPRLFAAAGRRPQSGKRATVEDRLE